MVSQLGTSRNSVPETAFQIIISPQKGEKLYTEQCQHLFSSSKLSMKFGRTALLQAYKQSKREQATGKRGLIQSSYYHFGDQFIQTLAPLSASLSLFGKVCISVELLACFSSHSQELLRIIAHPRKAHLTSCSTEVLIHHLLLSLKVKNFMFLLQLLKQSNPSQSIHSA